jgi:hypothetical protein
VEAVTRAKEVDEEMKRIIKQIEYATWNWVDPLWELTQNDEWNVTTNSANSIQAYALNQYVDLAGMSQQEKTIFIQNLRLDYQFAPSMTDATTGDAVRMIWMVTDQPIKQTDFIGPGWRFAGLNAENCAIMQEDVWTVTTSSAAWSTTPVLTSSVSNGLMTSTASDRLYLHGYVQVVTRKIGPTTSTLSSVQFGGVRLVLDVEAREEPMYQYLMRLMRSYELQQSPDRD